METFTQDERHLLAALPQAIGGAVAVAGRSGLFGTGKEMFANSRALLEGAKAYPGNPIIRDVVPDVASTDRGGEIEQMKQTRDWSIARIKAKGVDSAESMIAMVVEDAREVAALLKAKAEPAQAAEYRAWTLAVAEQVANAATEGGILGFGGERLSEPESRLIAQLKDALGA